VKNYRFAGKGLEIDYLQTFRSNQLKLTLSAFILPYLREKGGKTEIGSHVKFEQSVAQSPQDNKSEGK
jgi:hypothetical protein